MVPLSFAGHALHPLRSGALWWPAAGTLLVADLHFEKASHYAARGWMLPPFDSVATLRRLLDDIHATGARRLVALGDSFHDAGGPDRLGGEAARMLARACDRATWTWVTGNHDPALPSWLGRSAALVEIGGVALRHEADPADPRPQIGGHFHPKIAVAARGRRITRRCFVVGPARLLLPAYGALAGGLDANDSAIRAAVGHPAVAHVPLAGAVLRVPLAA